MVISAPRQLYACKELPSTRGHLRAQILHWGQSPPRQVVWPYWIEIIGIQDFTLRLFNGMGKVDLLLPNDTSDFGVGWQGDVGIPGERGLPGPRGATVSTTLLVNQTDTKGATFSNCIVPGDFQQQRNCDPVKGSDSALADSPVQMQSDSFNFLWQRKLKLPKKLVRSDWAVSRSLIKQW